MFFRQVLFQKKSSSFTIYTFSKIFLTNFQQSLEKLVKLHHQLSLQAETFMSPIFLGLSA